MGEFNLDGKRVLITGGTGSLGSRIIERAIKSDFGNVEDICVFSRDEFKQHLMKLRFPEITYVLGDVRNKDSILKVMSTFKPDIVIHTSALKHVPASEFNPMEFVETNIIGTNNVIEACHSTSWPRAFICISSDKVCNASDTMGLTKALTEKLVFAGRNVIRSCSIYGIRYGNVMNSRGSLIPNLIERAKAGKSLTITDRDCTRFFIRIDDACDHVVRAVSGACSCDGIYIPKHNSYRILDVVEVLSEIYGCPIEDIGLRAGERPWATLLTLEESLRTVEFSDHYQVHGEMKEKPTGFPIVSKEISSADFIVSKETVREHLMEIINEN